MCIVLVKVTAYNISSTIYVGGGGALCHDKEPLDTERKSSGYHPSLEHQIHHQFLLWNWLL